ncbi:MAG: hypothetical protein F4157_03560 [Synechococcus sp. SB0675_bin_6]|nr:hypothetical protein [Synechococcus sp. SB0675_bin_6]
MPMTGRSRLWLTVAVLLAPLSPALAQSTGEFSMVLSSTYNTTSLKHEGTVFTAGSLQGSATVTSGSGSLFQQGENFLRSCIVSSERSEDGLNLRSHCILTEAGEDGGDQVWMSVYRNQGDPIGVAQDGRGRTEFVGGTGKYTGITGHCAYDVQYLIPSLGVLMADCNWSKP